MLKHRLLVGVPMAAIALGLFAADRGPYYPGLFVLALLVGIVCVRELRLFVPAAVRPRLAVTTCGVVLVLAANWYGVAARPPDSAMPPSSPWPAVLFTLTAMFLLAATYEVLTFTGDGTATGRLVGTVFAVVYLGVLPAFLIQLRWLPVVGLWAVLATVFVPKVGDIGAYFTGRLLGRHRMTPILSPKKTWEGLAGGLLAAAGTAVGISLAAPTMFSRGQAEAATFGVTIGIVGVIGDLFESLLKRDAQMKDASASIPGFGGALDVIDSVLYAAPVAYLWLTLSH